MHVAVTSQITWHTLVYGVAPAALATNKDAVLTRQMRSIGGRIGQRYGLGLSSTMVWLSGVWVCANVNVVERRVCVGVFNRMGGHTNTFQITLDSSFCTKALLVQLVSRFGVLVARAHVVCDVFV